ncbi:MAG: dethiobiotin synthase [Streptosporangiaceae bacterium]|jgi:dethiobiotin synthetase
MTVLVVTGTSTSVGKTAVTAALAALNPSCAVVKPVQTGGDSDISVVTRLSGVTDTHELASYPDPLSPEAAARVSARKPPDLSAFAAYIRSLPNDLVLVEGAGGLLVRYDPAGSTLADLAAMLDAPVLVVVPAGLGSLNHTALTLEALRARGLTCAGVVIGSWPASPGLAERENLGDLRTLADAPLAGVLPSGASALTREQFLPVARAGLSPAFGGTFAGSTHRP